MASGSATFGSIAYIPTFFDFAIHHSSTELYCADISATITAAEATYTDVSATSTYLTVYLWETNSGSTTYGLTTELGYPISEFGFLRVQLMKPQISFLPVHAEFFSATGVGNMTATVWLGGREETYIPFTVFLRLQCTGYFILTNDFLDVAKSFIDLQATLQKPITATVPVHAYFPVLNDYDGQVVPSTFYPIGGVHPLFTGPFGMPEWMDMTKNPYSAGQRVYGGVQEGVNDVSSDVNNLTMSLFINTCNPYLSWIGMVEVPVEAVTSVHSDGQMLMSATTKHDWVLNNYDMRPQNTGTVFDLYYFDSVNAQLYLRFNNGKYNSVVINGRYSCPVSIHHIWNALDDLSLYLNLSRLYLESDESLRNRALDVFSTINLSGTYGGIAFDGNYSKIGNSTFMGASLAIARELGLSSTNTAGLTVNVYGTYSKGFIMKYHDDFGRPLGTLNEVAKLFSHIGRSFGKFVWGRTSIDSSTFDYVTKLSDE